MDDVKMRRSGLRATPVVVAMGVMVLVALGGLGAGTPCDPHRSGPRAARGVNESAVS
jgi:hypothetical protein